MPQIEFNPSEFAGHLTPSVLPAAAYQGRVIDTQWRTPRSSDGKFLQAGIQITEGEHEGRIVFARFHLKSAVAATVLIAQRELASLCAALGIGALKDSEQLHDKPLTVVLGVKRRDGVGDLVNCVTAFGPPGTTPDTAPNARPPRRTRATTPGK